MRDTIVDVTINASTVTGALLVPDTDDKIAFMILAAFSGDIVVETSPDGQEWFPIDSQIGLVNATARNVRPLSNVAKFLRLNITRNAGSVRTLGYFGGAK